MIKKLIKTYQFKIRKEIEKKVCNKYKHI